MFSVPKVILKPKQRYTDDEIKIFLQSGLGVRAISKIYHVSPKRVIRISHNEDSSGQGRPKKLTDEENEWILQMFHTEVRSTISKVRRKFHETFHKNISHGYVSKLLSGNGYKYTKPLKIQKLLEHQKIIRYNFAQEIIQKHGDPNDPFWKSLIFSDESRFCSNSDCFRIWRKSDDTRLEVCEELAKFDINTMIWGAIGVNFKSALVFIHGAVSADRYLEFLSRTHFYDQVRDAYRDRPVLFQQDGAPAHTASSTIEKLKEEIELLIGWPPNSPDLSPIEMIWAIIKRRISYSERPFPTSLNELENRIQEEWDNLDQRMINSLVLSFQERLKMVLKTKGESISQYLSKHMDSTNINEAQYENLPHPPLFDERSDSLMLDLFNKMGRKWTSISKRLPKPFPPQSVKYRILCLLNKEITQEDVPHVEEPTLTIDDDETSDIENQDNISDDHQQEELEIDNQRRKRHQITFAFNAPKKKSSHESSDDSSDSHFFREMSTDDDILLTSE